MHYDDYTLRRRKQQSRSRPKTRTVNIILATTLVVLLAIFFRTQKNNETVSPLAEAQEQPQKNISDSVPFFEKISTLVKDATTIEEDPVRPEENLLAEIKSIVENTPGFYSVYVYNIRTGNGFGINETTIFRAASVNKIPTLAGLYFLAQEGSIDLDDRITLQRSDIVDFGTGVLRYEGVGRSYSLKTLANLLISKSDNTANYVLGEKVIGFSKIQSLIKDWGLTQTDIETNKTSNQDVAQLLIKMYQGNITNPASTQEMMGFFVDTDFENRLPRDLPKNIKVYHKIGNEDGNIHDVGIIELMNNPYYIGVLSNDIVNTEQTEDMIAEISLKVFEFYTEQLEKKESGN